MMSTLRGLLALMAISLLAACASRGSRVEAPQPLQDPEAIAAAQARQATREAWLGGHSMWSFEGRVAVSQGSKGGSGRLDWEQRDRAFIASLSAPITRQSWRLSADGQGARLEGLEGGTREGPDADRLLREATGWDIPVQTLADWARGVAGGGPAAYDASGRLQSLERAGWAIRYTDWQAEAGPLPAMPRRIEAQRGEARVRLIVDRWNFGDTP